MDLDPQSFFLKVTESLKDPENKNLDCLRLLDAFYRNLIEEQIDSALLDSCLPHFFYTSNSLLNFVDKASKTVLKKQCVKAIEILYTILNNFYHRLSEKEKHSLYNVGSRMIKSLTDASIKTHFIDLVIRSLEKSDGFIKKDAVNVYEDLYNALYFALQQKSPNTVKNKEMELMGYLSKKYSFVIKDGHKARKIFERNFDIYSITIKAMSHPAVCGFYTGFGYLLEAFPLNLDAPDEKKLVDKLYKHIKYLVVLNPNDRIKQGNRAALSFFATYTFLFKQNLVNEYEFWHAKLLNWLTCGVEEKKVGAHALKAFYQIISKVLEESNDEGCKIIVQYFVSYCKKVLNTKEATNYEKRSAIFCLREFSSAAHRHLDSKEVTDVFLVIMNIFENTFTQDYNPQNEEWEYLPDYIQTVANFMRFKEFTTSQFFCLQKGVISTIKSFHQLPYLHHGLVIDSLLLTLFYLKKTQFFDTFLENVVYQGVVWSCSHHHLAAEAFSDDPSQKLITVKNYYHLWRGVLRLPSILHYDRYEFYLEDRKYILQRMINELVKSLMVLVNKLNVSVSLKDENHTVTALEKAYKVEERNDYAIFLNVVDFYKDIFDNIESKMFVKCIAKMIDHLVCKCVKYPLISGFYKLLSFCLKISRNLSLFKDQTQEQNINNCRETLTTFLTSLLNKMAEFKDDLLISCLQVLLETPVEIIEPMLPSCVIPFTNIFEVGRSYLPLAEMGVDTLEYWQDNLNPEILDPFLAQVVPGLDSFLRFKFLRGYTTQAVEKRRKTMQALKKRKILEEIEPELVKLQRKILCFIGRQSLKNCQNFIFSDSNFIQNSISGQSSHLKLTLPYEELQLDMYLDTFLPRVIELSMFSSDRKTRIISCELLQACIMIFLGRAKQMSKTGLEELNNMLETLTMPLLQLSCDLDQVVKQIFEPLFLQLIHWYTSPTQAQGEHTAIIIEALLEGITHPTNSNLKDFSGKCITEFIKWTLKHQNLKPESSIKVLIKKMRFFSSHPDLSKKLGAALIFNSIYKELREEERFVSMFWLDILHIFVTSLDLVTNLEETTAVKEIKRSIKNLQRVIIEKPSIFRKLDEKRRVPNGLNNGLLTDISIWLLNQTSTNSKHCREACMELFTNIAPLSIEKRLKLHDFVNNYYDKTLRTLFDVKIKFEESPHDCASLLNYMRNLLCCLDGYKFIVNNNLEEIGFNERVFSEAEYFLEKLQTADLLTSLNLLEQKTWTYTSLDRDMFVSLKSACILSILRLYNAFIQHITPDTLWSKDFWKLLVNIIFYPHDLGINDGDYRDVLVILLNVIPKKLKKPLVDTLRNLLQDTIRKHEFPVINMEKNVPLKHRNFLKGIVLLDSSTIGQEMEISLYTDQLLEQFILDFYGKAQENVVFVNQIQDTMHSYLLSLFELVLNEKYNLDKNIKMLLLSEYYIQSIDLVQKKHAGLFFLSTFGEAIVPTIIEDFETFLSLSLLVQDKSIVIDLIISIINYIIKEKSFNTHYNDVANILLAYWKDFVEFFNTNGKTMDLGIEFLSLFLQISKSASSDMQDWLTVCLVMCQNDNHFEIFGLLARITGNDITERQSNELKMALVVLTKKISLQTLNQEVITNNFNKLLTFLPVVKSLTIFEYLINTYVKNTLTIDIQNLLNTFIKHLDKNVQGLFLEKAYEMADIKTALEILPPIFYNCDLEVFEIFFVNNIKKVLAKFEEKDLEQSIIHFILLEILFLRIPIGSAERINCPIATASENPKLPKLLLKYTLDAFKINNQDNITRKYKCHAYNALASIVSNSLKKNSFYEKLFIRQSENSEILWHGIINTEIKYDFPREFDSLPIQKKTLVNIRNEMRQKTGNTSNTLPYIESQRLFNSSLSEDVTKFDFTNSVLRSERQAERKIAENLQIQSEVYLDMTEINKHECMGTVCSLIQHIFDSGISELPTEDEEDVKLPIWMNGIKSLLLSEDTHKNVKIFLVKVIDNMIPIFNRYAKFFLEPLIQFVVDKVAGESINYFVTDVLVIISKWSTEIRDLSETESRLASKLLEHFIKNIEKDRNDVFKYNIELLKLLVESWSIYLTPPVNTIFEMLSTEETSEVAIYVCSVLLVNNIEVWERGSEHTFLNLMLTQLERKRSIYRACSETLGPLLNVLKAQEFVDSVKLKLNDIEELEQFVNCLEGVAIKFPQIIDVFHISRLIISFNQVPAAQKITHLKIINRRLEISLDILENISEFKIVNWDQHIEDSNLEIQILTLEIVKKSILILSTYPNFPRIIDTLARNVCHPNAIFRGCLYDTAISIYNLHRNDNLCKEILIYGLVDPDLENQKKIMDFWSHNSDLPQKIIQRFAFLLSEMYKTKIEDKLLGLSTYFLITLLNETEKYDEEIFEHPLEDCDFEEYKLQTNWKVQHPSVVPMFAETLDISSIESSASDVDQDVFLLRKTQTNMEFAPTQSYQEQQLSKFAALESSLALDLDPLFKDPNSVALSQKYKFKKRFLKDKSKISRNMAHYVTHKQIQKTQERVESAVESEKRVTIYRSYRKGDFPDIQIPLSAILKPLQMLALNDCEISKILFIEIFKGLASKTENNLNFLSTISEAIKNIFETSVQFNRYLFSALLDILLKYKEKIPLDFSLIARVAQESGLSSTGALLIEEYIISGVKDDGPSTSKRNFRQDTNETISWIKLAELYKDLEEWDTVRSIFWEKMDCDCKDSIQKALMFESKSMFKEARSLYEDMIKTDISLNRRDFYYESYFKCFASLGEWNKIPNVIGSVVEDEDTWEGLWNDPWCKQKLLPWYITSEVKNQLFTEETNEKFLNNLNKCLMDPKHSEYLTSNFPEELCMLWLSQHDIPAAGQYLKTCIKNFLEEWQIINPLFQSQRFQKLLNLQNVIEIADFIEINNTLTDNIEKSLNVLTNRWQRDQNHPPPSVLFSETKLLYRKQFIYIITDKLENLEGIDVSQQIKNLKIAKVRMDVDLINTAAEFGSFYVSRKYYKPYVNKENAKLNLAKGTIMVLKSKTEKDPSEKVRFLLDAVKNFEKNLTSDKSTLILKSAGKIFDSTFEIAQLYSKNKELYLHSETLMSNYPELATKYSSPDIDKLAYGILRDAAESCNTSEMDVDTCDNTETMNKFKEISDAYIKLAHYIKDKGHENLQGDFILFVLRAMKLDSSEARQLFPCILMQNDLGTIHKELFKEEVEKIPTWMFLGWLPQLLANVDSPKIFAISKIILRIAETYPQAIMYPYRLSKENYNFTKDGVEVESIELTKRLENLLLNDQKIDKFLMALSYVCVPSSVLKYYIGKIHKSRNMESVKKYVQELQREVFGQPCGTSDINNLQGDMFAKTSIQKYKKEFDKFSAKGMTVSKVQDLCKKLNKDVDLMISDKKVKNSSLLKDYSPWLANFSANKLNMELEIPGQYSGEKLPLTQHHVKISSFYPEIKIMKSLRKPIKITVLGTNTKNYPFLLKFGEDIRQDERIEQLFCLVNDFLRNDHSCSNNGLDILTYQVIPLTPKLGLIEWVDDTQPLTDFISKSLKNKTDFEENCPKEYERNLNGGNKNPFHAYGSAAVKIKKEKVMVNYKTLVKKVPWDILRTSFWTLSTSTENYIALRNNFIKTHAVICAIHWVLGIGDRHLGNSLVSLRNGKVLGIDFGHAFGTGTQIQPIPELVPFRLTPHLISLMEPLKERGPFREYMIHCIRCLRTNSPSLLATMNVFIQEPSIDWLEHSGMTDDNLISDKWYPVVKIEQARRKLQGANSVDIMMEELRDGTRDENYTAAYIKHVKGEQGSDFRTGFVGREDLSVEEQVDCLIDHATDCNLLGRMWMGWNPWV